MKNLIGKPVIYRQRHSNELKTAAIEKCQVLYGVQCGNKILLTLDDGNTVDGFNCYLLEPFSLAELISEAGKEEKPA